VTEGSGSRASPATCSGTTARERGGRARPPPKGNGHRDRRKPRLSRRSKPGAVYPPVVSPGRRSPRGPEHWGQRTGALPAPRGGHQTCDGRSRVLVQGSASLTRSFPLLCPEPQGCRTVDKTRRRSETILHRQYNVGIFLVATYCFRCKLNAMHGIEQVFTLRIDAHSQLLTFATQALF
jgi:hypothetical protein